MKKMSLLSLAVFITIFSGCDWFGGSKETATTEQTQIQTQEQPKTEVTQVATPILNIATAEDFKKEVIDYGKAVVVEFMAPGCEICKKMAPVVEKAAQDMKDKVKVVTVNFDVSKDLVQENGVEKTPTFLFFNAGKKVDDKLVGEVSEQDFMNKIKDTFKEELK